MMKCVPVVSADHLDVPALVQMIELGLKFLAETRLEVGVEADDFPRVQLTCTVRMGNEHWFVLDLSVGFSIKLPLFTKVTYQ